MDIKNNKTVAIIGIVVIVGSLLYAVWPFMNQNSENIQIAAGVQQPAGSTLPVTNIPVMPQQNVPSALPVVQQPTPVEEPQEDLAAGLYPFLNEQERQVYLNIDNVQQLPSYSVSAIVYSPSKAIINGQIVKEGDTIDTFVVLRIKEESVILSDKKSLYSVRLKKAGE
jgi:hypothetical protein